MNSDYIYNDNAFDKNKKMPRPSTPGQANSIMFHETCSAFPPFALGIISNILYPGFHQR
jgi:hypothetical protein